RLVKERRTVILQPIGIFVVVGRTHLFRLLAFEDLPVFALHVGSCGVVGIGESGQVDPAVDQRFTQAFALGVLVGREDAVAQKEHGVPAAGVVGIARRRWYSRA